MRLIKAVFGLKMYDKEWRDLEVWCGADQGREPPQVEGRKRRWGQYKKERDQFSEPLTREHGEPSRDELER